MTSKKEMLQAIRDFVLQERQRRGIADAELGMEPRREYPNEGGEFYSLLWIQLFNTREGHGCWAELESPEILQGVHEEVQKALQSPAVPSR